jgi:hypothetical protein
MRVPALLFPGVTMERMRELPLAGPASASATTRAQARRPDSAWPPWPRTILIEAVLAASVPSTTGGFAARYHQIRRWRHKKAVIHGADAILVAAYHLLARETDYYDRRYAEGARHHAGTPRRQARTRGP